jgi:hypothetical protein
MKAVVTIFGIAVDASFICYPLGSLLTFFFGTAITGNNGNNGQQQAILGNIRILGNIVVYQAASPYLRIVNPF